MNDGNTGIHVAPITEDEMNKVQAILKRAIDATMAFSQISADVAMLRDTVSALQADTERLRNQNNALDEALNHSRQVRDEQAKKLADTYQLLDMTASEKHDAEVKAERLERDKGQLEIDLDLTRKAKDDAEFKCLELEDKLAQAEAKLAKVAELHRSLFPEPKPEDAAKPEPSLAGWDNKVAISDEPVAKPAEPAPITDSRPESVDEWQPGYSWDGHTRKYWRNDVTPKPDGVDLPF